MSTDTRTHGKGIGTLDKDTRFELLSNERRRHVIDILLSVDSIDKGSLTDRVAGRELQKQPEKLTSKERKRVLVGLHQCHLPKLEDAKVVEIDRQTIKAGENIQQFSEYVQDETSLKELFRSTVLELI